MTAWNIYWILQLDSISTALFIAFLFTLLAGIFFTIHGNIEQEAVPKLVGKRLLIVSAIAFTICTFLPSTKTAAAIVLLPAIANNEVIQKEAGELYTLAKEALKKAAE